MCIVCYGSPLDTKLNKHHVSYFPEIIAYVHYDCHNKIHDPDNPLTAFIQYSVGDSKKFYDMEEHRNKSGSSIKSRLLTQ